MKLDLSVDVQCVNCLEFEHPHPRFDRNDIGRCEVTDAAHNWIEKHQCGVFKWDTLDSILARIIRITEREVDEKILIPLLKE